MLSACGSARSTEPADTVPPSVVLSVSPSPIALDSDFAVDGSVLDAGGVASLIIDGTVVPLQGGNTFSVTLHSPASVGPVTVTAQATDRAGNRVDTSVVFTSRPQRFQATVAGIPRADSVLQQPEFVLTVTAPTQLTTTTAIFVDQTMESLAAPQVAPYMLTSPVLREGPHTIHIMVAPQPGIREYDTTFTLNTHFAPVNYQATVLAPLDSDYDAVGTDMNDSGVVVGWSQNWGTGAHRPVRWVNGTAEVLPLDTATMGWADAIDAHGDIVGKVMRVDSAFEAAAIWHGGDSLRALAGTPEALRINAAGQVLLAGGRYGDLDPSLYDIATGTYTALWPKAEGAVVDLNAHGAVVGFTNTIYQFASPLTFGAVSIDSMPPLPADPGAVFYEPVDVNDSGQTLLTENGRWILSTGAGAQFATPFIGPATTGVPARLNNTGLVATTAADKTIYIWDRTAGVTRVVSTDPGWGFDAVYRISDSGVILAHGVNGTTGARGPVVLTPIK